MSERYNAYLYILDSDQQIILAENVSRDDAIVACRTQLLYLPKLGRAGDCWLDRDGVPRLAVVDAEQQKQYAHLMDRYAKVHRLGAFVEELTEKYETW
jgi:hypothetical protein